MDEWQRPPPSAWLNKLRQPNCMTSAGLVLDHMRDDGKSILVEQTPVFVGVQARVVQGFAFECSHCDAVAGSRGEHQSGPWRGVVPKDRKHPSLVFGTEVEKAVPCKKSVKTHGQRQGAHVGHPPALGGQCAFTQSDHFGRSVDPSYGATALNQIAAHRLARPATDVENGRLARHQTDKTIEPIRLHELLSCTPPLLCPSVCVSPIEADDRFGSVTHTISQSSGSRITPPQMT